MSKPSKRSFVVYAIFSSETKTAFIGKSYGSDLGPTYSRHVHGKHRYTRDHLSKSALKDGEIPRLSILQRLERVDFREAYAYLVAWTRLFLENNYYTVMQEGVIDDALHLHPKTEKIYLSMKDESLENILQQNTCFPKTNVRKKATDPMLSKPKSVQFNIRVQPQDKDYYNARCQKEAMTKKICFHCS